MINRSLLSLRSLVFGAALSSSSIGTVVADGRYSTIIIVATSLPLFYLTSFKTKSLGRLRNAINNSALAIIFSIVASFFVSAFTHGAIGFNKTLGVVFCLYLFLNVSRYLPAPAIKRGLVTFIMIESIVLGISHDYWNSNALCMRLATVGIVMISLVDSRIARLVILCFVTTITISLQSRTATFAFLLIACGLLIREVIQSNPSVFKYLIVIGFLSGLALHPYVMSQVQQLALKNLGSHNAFTEFFLRDKNVRRIANDFFDRRHAWEGAWRLIRSNPVLGIGPGLESEILHGRAHNAYLSLALDGGIIYLSSWVVFYIVALGASRYEHDRQLQALLIATSGYMFMASFFESSGFGSVSSPINLIFIAIAGRCNFLGSTENI